MLRLLLLLSVAGLMFAGPIPGLNNTGTNVSGGVDQSWTVTPLPGGIPGPSFNGVVVTGWPIGIWPGNDATSSWIGRVSDYTGQTDLQNTVYRFDLNFTLAAEQADWAWFRFRLAADNEIALDNLGVSLVFLNNTQIPGVAAPSGFAFSEVYTVDSGFQENNTLSVYVLNTSGTTGNPMGLRLEFTDSAETPEPGTFALLGGALCGIGLFTRLRRK